VHISHLPMHARSLTHLMFLDSTTITTYAQGDKLWSYS
jgi:hypothetical protein